MKSMKQKTIVNIIGALCSDDYKGINNQYVGQGKVVVVGMGRTPIRSMETNAESRTATAFRRKCGGGSENIVTEEIKAVDAKSFVENDVNGTITCSAGHNVESNNIARIQYAVRRLTPTECERLQGLPDGYTLIDDKSCSDSARYRALGNGMCQNCADFVIRRIVEEVETEKAD